MRRAIAQVALITLIGQAFGLIREIVYAAYFGVSREFDVLNISLNAISSVATALAAVPLFVIPWLISAKDHGQNERFAQILTSILLCLGVVALPTVVVVELFPGTVLGAIAPGIPAKSDSGELAVFILRAMTPQILLYALTYVAKALANMYASYTVVAAESIITNLAIIGVVILGHRLAPSLGVMYVVAGYYVGLTLYCGLCLAAVIRRRGATWLKWRFDRTLTGELARAVVGFSLATLVAYVTPVLFYRFASTTGVGNVSVLSYASRILTVSMGTITNSIMLVYFPRATGELAEGRRSNVVHGLQRLTGALYSMSLLVATVLVCYGEELVSVLYVKGSFKRESAELLCSLFPFYVPWLIFYPITTVLHQLLMGAKRYWTIFSVDFFAAILVCLLGYAFASYGVRGVTLMISMHRTVVALLLMILVTRALQFSPNAYLRSLVRPTVIFGLALAPIVYGYLLDKALLLIAVVGLAALLMWNVYGQYLGTPRTRGAGT